LLTFSFFKFIKSEAKASELRAGCGKAESQELEAERIKTVS